MTWMLPSVAALMWLDAPSLSRDRPCLTRQKPISGEKTNFRHVSVIGKRVRTRNKCQRVTGHVIMIMPNTNLLQFKWSPQRNWNYSPYPHDFGKLEMHFLIYECYTWMIRHSNQTLNFAKMDLCTTWDKQDINRLVLFWWSLKTDRLVSKKNKWPIKDCNRMITCFSMCTSVILNYFDLIAVSINWTQIPFHVLAD